MDEQVRPVVVGVDGSESSNAAAQFAAGYAQWRSLPLELVYGLLRPLTYAPPIDPLEVAEPAADDVAAGLMDEVGTRMTEKWPGLRVRVREVLGGAPTVLIDESSDAELVALGSRGHGGFKGLLLGSVSTKVAAYAKCPVVVMRSTGWSPPLPASAPVVVGVDGSEEATLAVEQAADEAARLEQTLTVIHVDADPPDAAPSSDAVASSASVSAEAVLTDAVKLAQGRHPGLAIREELVHGIGAQQALLDAGRSAALVAVGSRGRGGFTGLVMGSVSQALVQYCACPVLIAHRRGPSSNHPTADVAIPG